MSARLPFVPTRAPSRVGSTGNPAVQDRSTENHFDFTTPLNDIIKSPDDAPKDVATSGADLSKVSSSGAPESIVNGINKPLNLAGFAKRTNPSGQHAFSAISSKTRRSFDSALRSRSPDLAQHHAPRSRPFSPFFPHNQEHMRSHARAPRHSSPPRIQTSTSVDDLSSNQAHIPTSRPFAADSALTDNSGNLSFSSSVPNLRVSARSSLEKIQEAAEEEDATGDQQYHGRAQGVRLGVQAAPNGLVLRRSGKRIQHPEPEIEDEYDYPPAMKRYKGDDAAQDKDIEDRGYDRSSPIYIQDSEGPAQPVRDIQNRFAEFDVNQSRQPTAAAEESALRRLLGQELDKYVDEHLDAYNEARKKWSDCSTEEWQAGASELTAKFGKLLDFVKDHMTAKINLYTTLHAHVTNHRVVLSQREDRLKEARESLVRSGGSVVGTMKTSSKRIEGTPHMDA